MCDGGDRPQPHHRPRLVQSGTNKPNVKTCMAIDMRSFGETDERETSYLELLDARTPCKEETPNWTRPAAAHRTSGFLHFLISRAYYTRIEKEDQSDEGEQS